MPATAPSDVYDTPLPASRCDAADTLCVDLAATAPLWWTEDGWLVGDVSIGDVDGDGDLDAVVELLSVNAAEPDRRTPLHTSVIYGPFGAAKVLPRDEDVSIESASGPVGDASGDGIADVVLESGPSVEPDLAILLGPLTTWDADESAARDLTAPGYVRGPRRGLAYHQLTYVREGTSDRDPNFWSGAYDTWGAGSATFTVSIDCESCTDLTFDWIGDVDGDGLEEMSIGGGGTWFLAGDVAGDVVLPGFADAIDPGTTGQGDEPPVALGDVNADGREDFSFASSWLAGPLTMDAATGFTGGSALFASAPVEGIEPAHVDLDGDGRQDFRRQVAEVAGTSVDWSLSPLRAFVYEYLTSEQGGGVYTGVGVGRVIHDRPSNVDAFHVESDGPHAVFWWPDGDGVVVVRIPGT